MNKGGEAKIIINGVELTAAQSQVVRMGMQRFEQIMSELGVLGNDSTSMILAERYKNHATEVIKLIFKEVKMDL